MADDKTTDTSKEEEKKEDTEDTTATDTATEEGAEGETGEESEDSSSTTTKELDLDKELEEENKRGKPDPIKAKKAFDERQAKREAGEAEEEGDKPVTRKELAELEQRAIKRANEAQALTIAKGMAASEKEAQLIFAKWKNREFPENLPLTDQLEEAYAITHRKKLIGERNEALRAARNKANANKGAGSTAHDSGIAGEPKLSDADKYAMTAAGYVWDGAKRLYKKPLGGGKSHLYKDPKTGRTWRAA